MPCPIWMSLWHSDLMALPQSLEFRLKAYMWPGLTSEQRKISPSPLPTTSLLPLYLPIPIRSICVIWQVNGLSCLATCVLLTCLYLCISLPSAYSLSPSLMSLGHWAQLSAPMCLLSLAKECAPRRGILAGEGRNTGLVGQGTVWIVQRPTPAQFLFQGCNNLTPECMLWNPSCILCCNKVCHDGWCIVAQDTITHTNCWNYY